MQISIKTAKGNDCTVDFIAGTIFMVQIGKSLNLNNTSRAYPASRSHTEMDNWPSNGTHYIKAEDNFIALDEHHAAIFNDTSKKHIYAEILAEKETLDKAIPGLSELLEAINAEDNYQYLFNKMMDDEYNDGVNPPSMPKTSSDELRKQYPRAALYVKADSYSNASNCHKSTAGDKAKKILISGGNMDEATNIMDNWLPESAQWD